MNPYQQPEGYRHHSPSFSDDQEHHHHHPHHHHHEDHHHSAPPPSHESPYPPPFASPYPPPHHNPPSSAHFPQEFFVRPEEPPYVPSHYAHIGHHGEPEPPHMPPQYAHIGHHGEPEPPHMPPQYAHIGHHGEPEPPHMPPQYAHIGHHSGPELTPHFPPHETAPALPRGQLVKLFCKVDRDYLVACHNDSVVMVPVNLHDEAQHWIKDDSFGVRVRDSYGFPAFALVNKGHKKVLKHAREKGQQVLVVDYTPGMQDDDILWTESQDFEGGYRTIRMASDTLLNMTVFHGDRKIHGLRNGSPIVLDTWHKQDNQLWKILPL